MTPVDQTMFYDPTAPPERQCGNCLSAVIASLLDLPLSDVPNFVQDHVDHDGETNRQWYWWHRLMAFINSHGWGLHSASLDTHFGEHLWVSGKSPRSSGVSHAVIYKDGVMVHDPHPDRLGVLTVENVHGLHRLDDADVRA
jgi:hypothetical protein